MSPQLKKTIKVISPSGLHARPASLFVKIANKFESTVNLTKDDQTVNGKSMMGILMLAAEQGSELIVEVIGEDAEKAMEEFENFLSSPTDHHGDGGVV